MTTRFVCAIADAGGASAVGGKAAARGELARAGFPVPEGYVVTAAAFGLIMDAVDPSGAVRGGLERLLSGAGRLRALIAAAPLPAGAAAEIAAAYEDLGTRAVAVRSSATMEDSPDASFAGLQDSYLGVCGSGTVLDRVRSCWASLYNDESVAYRRRKGIGEHGLAMAVVIQPMGRRALRHPAGHRVGAAGRRPGRPGPGGSHRAPAEPPGNGLGRPGAGTRGHVQAPPQRPRARPVREGVLMELTNADVADILALLDSLPYDELDLQTPRFRLTVRRTPDGWTQSGQVLSEPSPLEAPGSTGSMPHPSGYNRLDVTSSRLDRAAEDAGVTNDAGEFMAGGGVGAGRAGGGGEERGELVEVRAPLPGTFYRAPRPGAAPFVEVGSRVGTDTVIGIVETMKLMNSVHAGVAGTVAEFCVGNAEFTAQGAPLLRIRTEP